MVWESAAAGCARLGPAARREARRRARGRTVCVGPRGRPAVVVGAGASFGAATVCEESALPRLYVASQFLHWHAMMPGFVVT